MKPTVYQIRQWQRRADTIARKAYDLLYEMGEVIGTDNTETDWPDSLACEAETCADNLKRWADDLSKRPTPTR